MRKIKAEQRTNPGSRIIMVLISFYLILPLFLTFLYSLFTQWNDILPTGFTLRYYAALFTDADFILPFLRTVVISVSSVVICIIIVLLATYVVAIVHPSWKRMMQIICTIPYALQGIILGISVLALYTGMPLPFSNRIVMLIGTYCILILPYIYRGIQNSLNTVNAVQLIDAAQLLGLSRMGAYFRIIVPNIMKGIKVSAMLAVAILFGDFVIVNIIGGSYYQTAQMYLYKIMFQSGQMSSAIIVLLFAVTLIISGSVFLKRNSKIEKEK